MCGAGVASLGPSVLGEGPLLSRLPSDKGSCQPHLVLVHPQTLNDLKGKTEAIPCVVGGQEVWTSDVRYQLSVSAWLQGPWELQHCGVGQVSATLLLAR